MYSVNEAPGEMFIHGGGGGGGGWELYIDELC